MMRDDWVEIELGRVCEFVGGGTPSKKEPSYWNGGIPWASVKDIKGNYLTGTRDYISEQGLKNSAANLAQPEDIIVATRINPGRPIRTKIRTAINQDLKIAKTRIDIDRDFLFYAFLNIENEIRKVSSGTTVLGVNLNNLRDITFPLAPLPDQRAIVAKIEKIFSDLDNAIANLKAAKTKIEVYRAAVLHHAYENQDFASIKLEEIVEDHMIGIVRSGKDQNNAGKGVPYIKMNNVDLYGNIDLDDVVYVEVDDNELNKYRLNNDDILINTRNSYELVGKTGIVKNIKSDFVFNNNLLRIRVKKGINASFVAYQLISPLVRNQMREGKNATTNVCALYQRNIFPLRIKTAQLQEQHAIVAAIESRLSVCDKLAESIDQSLEKAEALRQSILKKAFAGRLLSEAELAACRREPDWEPAQKLLERIHKEKFDRSEKTDKKQRRVGEKFSCQGILDNCRGR